MPDAPIPVYNPEYGSTFFSLVVENSRVVDGLVAASLFATSGNGHLDVSR